MLRAVGRVALAELGSLLIGLVTLKLPLVYLIAKMWSINSKPNSPTTLDVRDHSFWILCPLR